MTWIPIYHRNGIRIAVKTDVDNSRPANVQCRYANRKHSPILMITVFSGVMPYSLVQVYRKFKETCCLHHKLGAE
jgi:hypothetical protein